MAINKKLIHFKNYSDFNSKKLSANETNTAYRLGVDGEVTSGNPDILFQSICWIKDVKKMWTHDTVYDCSGGANIDFSNYVTQAEFVEFVDNVNNDVANLTNTKQDNITDLADIRSGAAKGDTAVQPEDISYVTIDVDLENVDFIEDSFGANDVGQISLQIQNSWEELRQAVMDGKRLAIMYLESPIFFENVWIEDMVYCRFTHPITDMLYNVEITDENIFFSKCVKINEDELISKSLRCVDDKGKLINVSFELANKQVVIKDLDEIRDGATKGTTALQYYVTSFDLQKLLSDEDLLQDEVNKHSLLEAIRAKKLILMPIDNSLPYGYITLNCFIGDNLYISFVYGNRLCSIETGCGEHDDDIYASEITFAVLGDVSEFLTRDDLAAVATSGSYNDLQDKPTIPSAVTERTVSNWGFTKNIGTYSKPSDGIPKSDLATSVQESLSKAESAAHMEIIGELETVYTQALYDANSVYATPTAANGDEDDILLSKNSVKTINGESIFGSGDITIEGGSGTITEIQANGTSVATSGVANIPAATTSKYGVTKLTTSTNSSSTTLAATASAVKAVYDLANSFVPMTLNTSTTSFGTSLGLSPNQKYVSTIALANNVTFNINVASIDTTKDNTWALSFIMGSSARTISFAVSQTGYTIMWANGVAPTFEANTAYEITFKLVGTNLFGVCGAFKTV